MSADAPNPNGLPHDTAGTETAEAVRPADTDDQAQPPAPPSGTLAPERLQEISARLESGHYDRPEVLDHVARQILPELDTQVTSDE